MTALELKIKDAAQRYYSDGSSPLTDEEFDALVEQLRAETPESELLKTGWGYAAAYDTTGVKVQHKYGHVGSLAKVHKFDELPKDFVIYDVSLKLDGLSVVLYYESGRFVQALTRGDGSVGIDITSKIKSLVPCKLRYNFTGAIRGEILMSFEKFNEFKELHPDAKNPRNSAAGLINGNDMQFDIEYFLEVVAYTVVGWDNPSYDDWAAIAEDSDLRAILIRMYSGKIVPHRTIYGCVCDSGFDALMLELKHQWYNQYPADGIVLTSEYTHHPDTHELTWTSFAYKFPNESVQATVEDVEWSLSKTGYLIPRVKITPTEILGSTVSYCTGYNAQYIVDNQIGPGTVVTFSKRNEIIPNIDSIVSNSSDHEFTYPTTCPSCRNKLVWNGVHLMCNNLQCRNIQEQDILVWCDNIAPVDGLSDKIRTDIIADVRKEYGRATVDEFMNIARYKYEGLKALAASPLTRGRVVLAKELWGKLCSVEPISLVSALKALNIPRLGDKTADKFANHPDMIQTLMNSPTIQTDESFITLLRLTIGEANAESIIANSWKFKRLSYIAHRIVWCPSESSATVGKVAITGKLSVKRSEFEKELAEHGYSVGDISKATLFLITDDPTSSSSKNRKADQLGIKKITEAEFRETYLK